MKFTIIGHSGFIGGKIVEKLRSERYEYYLPKRDDQQLFDDDLGCVIYCAGKVANYMQDPFDTVQAHVVILANILKKSRFTRLVYLSSTRLYDGLSKANLVHSITEDVLLPLNPFNPRHLYDISKILGESLCLNMGLGKASVARLSCVYGLNAKGFINDLMHLTINNEKALIDSSPYYERDYVYVDDVVDGLIDIVTSGKKSVYNLASSKNVRNKEIFYKISQLTGCKIFTVHQDKPKPLANINIDLMKNEFSFHPIHILEKLPDLVKDYENEMTGKLIGN